MIGLENARSTTTGGGAIGEDTVVFAVSSGRDTIQDFDKVNDTIDVSMLPEAIAFSDLTLTALTDGRTAR